MHGEGRDPRARFLATEDDDRRACLLLIDPRPLTRASVSRLLETHLEEFDVVALPSVAALAEGHDARPAAEVVVLNLGGARVVDTHVLGDIEHLRRALPATPFLLLSDHEDFEDVAEGLRQGARGFVPTTMELSTLVHVVRLIRAGGTFVPASIVTTLIEGRRPAHRTNALLLRGFTPRQLQILELLREGKSNKMIGHELQLRESTVKVHLRRLMKKLHAINRTQAVFLADRMLTEAEHSGRDGATERFAG